MKASVGTPNTVGSEDHTGPERSARSLQAASTKTVRFHFRIVRRVVNQHVTFRAVTG